MVKRILVLIFMASILVACVYPVSAAISEVQGQEAPDEESSMINKVRLEPKESRVEPPAMMQDISKGEPLDDEPQDDGIGEDSGQAESGDAKEPKLGNTSSAINPLTGLPVQDPDNLALPPALVSVTNFPPTARPQAGLYYSPIVFEMFIGDGMTRYLAIFYGDYPRSEQLSTSEDLRAELTDGMDEPEPEPVASVGPIRSGRLPYESIRKLFNGFIVMASAYSKVADQLTDYVNVFGDDNTDVNSALIPVDDLEKIARANGDQLGDVSLAGMVFDDQVPTGGKLAPSLWIYYAYKNQVFWRYNEEDGSYHRWQDNADGVTFIEQTDRLNGEALTYENVIVLFADHDVQSTTMIDIDLLYVNRGKALLFRDGQMQEIYWTTKSEAYEKTTGKLRPIRFIDGDGNPFPLKPGQTWIELVPPYTVYWETVNSEKYNQLVAGRSKGSGYWGLYFDLDD